VELGQVGVTSLPLFEPSIFERALSFKRFLKRLGTLPT
jgi:hypothetical protein